MHDTTTAPTCVVCHEPTMQAGTDDHPWSKSWDESGYVCSERCRAREVVDNADPTADRMAILESALALYDDGEAVTVRVHRAACEPVEGVVVDSYRMNGGWISFTLLDDEGERDVLAAMVTRVEVVEGG